MKSLRQCHVALGVHFLTLVGVLAACQVVHMRQTSPYGGWLLKRHTALHGAIAACELLHVTL